MCSGISEIDLRDASHYALSATPTAAMSLINECARTSRSWSVSISLYLDRTNRYEDPLREGVARVGVEEVEEVACQVGALRWASTGLERPTGHARYPARRGAGVRQPGHVDVAVYSGFGWTRDVIRIHDTDTRPTAAIDEACPPSAHASTATPAASPSPRRPLPLPQRLMEPRRQI